MSRQLAPGASFNTNFRFHANKVHLTYQGHIPHEELLERLKRKGEGLKWFSVVSETSDSETPYNHTHVACEWKKIIDTKNPRYFDHYWIHPHIQKVNGLKHAKEIYYNYHRKAPVQLTQSDEAPDTALQVIDKIKEPESLYDACQLLGIAPKTVSDVKILREDKKRLPDFVHPFPNAEWTVFTPDNWKVLVVWGDSGTGKTMWATSLFANPLVVSHMDRLRDFNPDRHDGIVFDDMGFAHLPREACIHLVDTELARDIHCRYTTAHIPAGTKKVFTSNLPFDQLFPYDPSGAIRRRISKIIHVTGPTFVVAPPPPVLERQVHVDRENLPCSSSSSSAAATAGDDYGFDNYLSELNQPMDVDFDVNDDFLADIENIDPNTFN